MTTLSHETDPLPPVVSELSRLGPLVGGGALVVGLLIGLVSPLSFFPAYLACFLFFLGFGLGSLALLQIHYLAGGDWGFILRRPFEAAALTLPLMGLLFLPIVLLGMRTLYPWAGAEAAHNEIMHLKSGYLNVPFFLGRAVFYFAFWSGLAYYFRRAGVRQDATDDPGITWRAQAVAAPGLVFLFLSVTFAMVDWGMSIEPEWYSSIYGVMLFIGFGLSSLALGVLVVSRLAHVRPLSALVKPEGLNDIGNLMLAFTMLWAYMSFSQFLITWSGNLTEEIPWYLRRSLGIWRPVAGSLMALHFFVPFFYLLVRENKRSSLKLTRVAVWLLVMHLINDTWLILPAYESYQLPVSWGHQFVKLLCLVPAFLAVGGLWAGWYARQLAARPLVPRNDPLLAEALGHHQARAHAGGGH